MRKNGASTPEQIGDVLALIGDSVDNIPGVNGLGPKAPPRSSRNAGRSQALLTNLDAVKNERIREKLKAARDQIEQNREMVRLDLDLELPVPLEELALRPRFTELVEALEWCEFKSLMTELRADEALAKAASVSGPRPPLAQAELF